MDGGDAVAAVARGGRRLPRGTSDPVGMGPTRRDGEGAGEGEGERGISNHNNSCKCEPRSGSVVLFYAYTALADPGGVVARLHAACERGGVTGKLRVAAEVRQRHMYTRERSPNGTIMVGTPVTRGGGTVFLFRL
jgi:hypothetical protein